jgi:amino acid transporter
LVFEKHQLNWLAGVISVSAVVAITSVFLVFQIGQPRIFMSMARDGLLPKRFAKVHPRFKTPTFATIITCLGVAIPTLFLNADLVLDLCSMGTLFAFMFVSAGVLVLETQPNEAEKASGFRVPYINGRWIMPFLFVAYLVPCVAGWLPENHQVLSLSYWSTAIQEMDLSRVPYLVFFVVFLVFSALAVRGNWSVIPVLGVLTNLYLIAGLGHRNWILFFFWCLAGFAVYFLYGYWNSKLRRAKP